MKLTQLAISALDEVGMLPQTDATDAADDVFENAVVTEAVSEAKTNEDGEVESSEKSYTKTTNPDGTVNLSFSFSLDPVVVAQKAKALKKGIKRDDQSDLDLVDDDSEEDDVFADDVKVKDAKPAKVDKEDVDDDDDEDPYNGVSTEDTMFMDALDSIEGVETMDARKNSRHAQTPLENCRAKDPRFCPYHGIPAWQKHVEDALSKAGVSGQVSVNQDGGKFSVDIKDVDPYRATAAMDVISDIYDMKGILSDNKVNDVDNDNGGTDVSGSFKTDRGMTDKTGLLNEWVDNYMADIVSDPNAEFDMDDFNDLLEAQEKLETFEKGMDVNNPNDKTQYDTLLADAEKKYHALMAQQYMSHVKTPQDAKTEFDKISADYGKADKDFQAGIAEVRQMKSDIFRRKGEFPPSNKKKGIPAFQDQHAWVKKYNNSSRAVGMAGKDYHSVEAKVSAILGAGNVDMKELRTVLAEMDYKRESFEGVGERYKKANGQFKKDFYDWATKEASDPNNKYGITSAMVSTAFPNGKPQ